MLKHVTNMGTTVRMRIKNDNTEMIEIVKELDFVSVEDEGCMSSNAVNKMRVLCC